jgi:hypothetical protein
VGAASTYRLRPDRFLGVFAVGLIVLGVAAVLWAVGAPDSVIAVAVVIGGVTALGGLWILGRPPVLARLTNDGLVVRGIRRQWTDITGVDKVSTTHGEALALRTENEDDTMFIPLRWLRPRRATALQVDIRDRLNAAHGYKPWDGT